MYINSSFLSYIQSLEIYHRRKFDSKLFLESDYNTYMEKLKVFVEKEIPEFTAKIDSMKQHGNEVNLGKRLKEIISSLSGDSKSYLFGNSKKRDKFIMQLVETRNYLTHFDKTRKKNILEDTNSLLNAVMRMQALITLTILIDLGIDEEIALNRIKESNK
ncbi:HEPN domain-containing protein [Lysinibacillus sp. NPDC097214]|uniref:HEPN domain-containing protein n=1 Tax=Lysinibacillus sp. NPDC097214 TaxID=3390584 RepID=UPI003D0277E5